VHRAAARSVAEPCEPQRSGTVSSAERQLHPQDRPTCRVDGTRRVAVRQGPRHPAAQAVRARLHQHRLRAVHDAPARSERPAVRSMAGPEARMRDSHRGEIAGQGSGGPEMKFNPKGLIVTGLFVLMVYAIFATQTVEAFDNLFSIAVAVLLVVTSLAILVARMRGVSAAGQSAAFREIQRWFSKH